MRRTADGHDRIFSELPSIRQNKASKSRLTPLRDRWAFVEDWNAKRHEKSFSLDPGSGIGCHHVDNGAVDFVLDHPKQKRTRLRIRTEQHLCNKATSRWDGHDGPDGYGI